MGCCFCKEREEDGDPVIDENTHLIQDNTNTINEDSSCGTSTPTVNLGRGEAGVYNSTHNLDSNPPVGQSCQFIQIDEKSNPVKENTDKLAIHKDRINSYLKNVKIHQTLPNVIDPSTVLLLPCAPKEDVEQVAQCSKIVASILEQMKPKCKEPIITPCL